VPPRSIYTARTVRACRTVRIGEVGINRVNVTRSHVRVSLPPAATCIRRPDTGGRSEGSVATEFIRRSRCVNFIRYIASYRITVHRYRVTELTSKVYGFYLQKFLLWFFPPIFPFFFFFEYPILEVKQRYLRWMRIFIFNAKTFAPVIRDYFVIITHYFAMDDTNRHNESLII